MFVTHVTQFGIGKMGLAQWTLAILACLTCIPITCSSRSDPPPQQDLQPSLATLIPDLSHDQVTRFLSQQALTDKDLWRIVKPHLRPIQSDEAVLILDDSVEEKPYTDESELICTHFDPVTGRYIAISKVST